MRKLLFRFRVERVHLLILKIIKYLASRILRCHTPHFFTSYRMVPRFYSRSPVRISLNKARLQLQ